MSCTSDENQNKLDDIKLPHKNNEWTRIIRSTDKKFQWTRFNSEGAIDIPDRFDILNSAYVAKLDLTDPDAQMPRMTCGTVALVMAQTNLVDSTIMNGDEELVSSDEIISVMNKSFEEKKQWFRQTCDRLRVEWNEGHMRMNVRRDYLLSDSMAAVMSLSRNDLRKVWRFEFIGEDNFGFDADGALAREWYQLVSEEFFNPDMGLWKPSATNQMRLEINHASGMLVQEDHLYYFRFIGRVLGKALFDGHVVKGHMATYLYKHLLSWPVMMSDIRRLNEGQYDSLRGLKEMGEDIEYVGVDFTIVEEYLGVKEIVELIFDGANIDVTEANLPEYLEAHMKYYLLGRYEQQMNELLLGFFDVIPEPLISIFDFQELELLVCGICVNDVKNLGVCESI